MVLESDGGDQNEDITFEISQVTHMVVGCCGGGPMLYVVDKHGHHSFGSDEMTVH